MAIPKAVSNLIILFFILLLLSILFANSIMAAISLVPLFFAIGGLVFRMPAGISVERSYDKYVLFTGETMWVHMEITIETGFGLLLFSEMLPSHFKVMEGSNFRVIWKGWGVTKTRLSYALLCTTSGTYSLGKVHWESRHSIFQHAVQGSFLKELTVEVRPRLLEIHKIKNTVQLSRIPMPLGAMASNGLPTLDFKEIRQYSYGDAFKYINWKASARNIRNGAIWPVINQYEKEGKKSVWIFLDRSSWMDFGSNVRNTFECGLEAVSGLSDYYLKEQCSISFCTYGGEDLFVYPGTGKKQYFRILKELMQLNTMESSKNKKNRKRTLDLKEVIQHHKNYFIGSRPLFIVITRSTEENLRQLTEAVDEMMKYCANLFSPPQIMVVNIQGHPLAAETHSERIAAEILGIMEKTSTEKLRKKCIWVDWDPTQLSFSNALLQQGVRS